MQSRRSRVSVGRLQGSAWTGATCAWWTVGASWAWTRTWFPWRGRDSVPLNAHGLLKRVDQKVYVQMTS